MKNLFVLLFSFSTLIICSQDRIPANLSETQLNINILQPSLSLEKKLSDKQSITFSVGITSVSGDDAFNDYKVGISPFIRTSFRNYYPRKKVKKELQPNSGNYIGLVTGYNFGSVADNLDNGSFSSENAFFMGPVWGFQRNYKSGIHLGLSLGAGFITGKNQDFDFTGVGTFELGFVIK